MLEILHQWLTRLEEEFLNYQTFNFKTHNQVHTYACSPSVSAKSESYWLWSTTRGRRKNIYNGGCGNMANEETLSFVYTHAFIYTLADPLQTLSLSLCVYVGELISKSSLAGRCLILSQGSSATEEKCVIWEFQKKKEPKKVQIMSGVLNNLSESRCFHVLIVCVWFPFFSLFF